MKYIGNCTNIFDSETGDCLEHIFENVSHFGSEEETFYERVENGDDGFITVHDFNDIVGDNDIVKDGWKCYFYPRENGNVYVAYDPIADVHWFWC